MRVTREMILKAAMVDSAAEVSAVMLRDHNIEVFDDNRTQQFSLDELCNVECLFLSHNLIKDLLGISQLTTLLELNLNFNNIQDIT